MMSLMFMPVVAYAEESIVPPKGKITGLNYGERAPYAGVLLNSVAAAKLLTSKEYSEKEWELKLKYELAKLSAELNLAIETQKVSYSALEKKHTTLMSIKNNEIDRLANIVSSKKDYSIWWASGGVIVGVGLTLAVVYAVQAGNK